jgi:hypothetical protein
MLVPDGKEVMMYQLKRVSIIPDGCFSVLLKDGKPVCVTCEHTYDGEPETVKIPKGKTKAYSTVYNKGGYATFEVVVPGHSRILFHKGNTEDQSAGCVLCGRYFGRLNGKVAVLDSAGGFKDFIASAADVGGSFELEVI